MQRFRNASLKNATDRINTSGPGPVSGISLTKVETTQEMSHFLTVFFDFAKTAFSPSWTTLIPTAQKGMNSSTARVKFVASSGAGCGMSPRSVEYHCAAMEVVAAVCGQARGPVSGHFSGNPT